MFEKSLDEGSFLSLEIAIGKPQALSLYVTAGLILAEDESVRLE